VGRSLAGDEGTLIFVSDHPRSSLPFGAALLAVGSPLENVGFAGLSIETDGGAANWRATLRNYSASPQSRRWVLASGNQRTEPRPVDLAPGETRTLQGRFPETVDRLSLILEADRFALDDQIFVVRPSPKPLLISRTGATNVEPVVASLLNSLENVRQSEAGETADLVFATYNPLKPSELPPTAVVFLNQEQVPKQFLSGHLVTANDPLIESLDWQGLISRSTPSIPILEGENVLLWQGDRPMILLREKGNASQLVFNFDVVHSNATRLPAFVVLIHRHLHRIRERKIGLEVTNLELNQPVNVAHDSGPEAPPLVMVSDSERRSIPVRRAVQIQAPAVPGFFQVLQGDTPLLDSSANFADPREADLSKAAALSELDSLPAEISRRQSTADAAWRLWVGLLATALLLAWYLLGRPRPEETATSLNRRLGL